MDECSGAAGWGDLAGRIRRASVYIDEDCSAQGASRYIDEDCSAAFWLDARSRKSTERLRTTNTNIDHIDRWWTGAVCPENLL